MTETQTYTITQALSGTRLDVAINRLNGGISRSQAQSMIKSGEILLCGRAAKTGQKVKTGDVVSIARQRESANDAIVPTKLNFKIVYEDDDIIVINKPYGLVVHPGAGKETETVVSAILGHTGLSPIGSPLRPGVVHRLDKGTSGLMVLAKTKKAHQALAKAFAKHEVVKEYFAIIQGHIVNKSGRIEAAIERDKIHRKRMKLSCGAQKAAVSEFEVVEYLNGATLVKVQIFTGRTHQIRVHMAFTKHPLLGDTLYGAKKLEKGTGHFLHSAKLGFAHPISGEQMNFEEPLPLRFAEALEQLKNN